jgi:Sec-independent protein translocase protein TatA
MQGTGHVPLPGAGKKPYRMLSIPDMAILGTAALLFFGPDQLPKVARKVGLFMRDVQNTSNQFIREMERAADEPTPGLDVPPHEPYDPTPYSDYTSTNGAAHELPEGPSAPYVDPWWTRISEAKPADLPEAPPPPSGGYQLPP